MNTKKRVGILFGGKSAEHEVSLQSAKNVIEAIDRDKYDVVLIGLDKTGRWYLGEEASYLLNADDPKLIRFKPTEKALALVPGSEQDSVVEMSTSKTIGSLDVVFPVLHGTYGEDGTMQGLLKLADIPFVGASVLGSAVGMDKDVMKRLLRDAGLPQAKFLIFHKHQLNEIDYANVSKKLGTPMFVKPANLGSSVGISKVKDESQFNDAITEAFEFDHKIVIEETIVGREIECAVLGNENPAASVPGEIVPKHEFYSYDAKYIDEDGADLVVPADLSKEVTKRIQETAIKVFQVLCCEGMARVDCFLTKNEKIYVNEINTIPGFTKISMYPKMWNASGISYADLIDRLLSLALERAAREKKLKVTF